MFKTTKEIVSLLMVFMLVTSSIATAFATNDHTDGTLVSYSGQGTEEYTVTVPATLRPGTSGTVTLNGTWPSNRIVNVISQTSVTLANNLDPSNTKTLVVTFPGIKEAGSNTVAQTFTEQVSVAGISDALFGEWSGKFYYTVDVTNASGSVIGKPDVEKNETPIPVTSKNTSGQDLNATSYEIVGNDKADLLKKLEDANLIVSGTSVDMLIEVDSDNFDGLAETTFDVSEIANPGDKVIILHFEETKQEWEFISEEIVNEEGTVTADFSSYSPVAFIVINADGTQEVIISKSPVLFGKYYELNGSSDLGNGISSVAIGYTFYEDGSCVCWWDDGSVDTWPIGTLRYARNHMYVPAYNYVDEYGNEKPWFSVEPDGVTVKLNIVDRTFTMVTPSTLIYDQEFVAMIGNGEGEYDEIKIILRENSTVDLVTSEGTDKMNFVQKGDVIAIEDVALKVHQNGAILAGCNMVFGLSGKHVDLHYESTYSYEVEGVKVSMIPHANGTADTYVDGELQLTAEFVIVGNVLYNQDGTGIAISDDGTVLTLFDFDGEAYLEIIKD